MTMSAQSANETQPAPRRNVNNARLAWILAAVVVLLYIGGLFIQRG